MTQHLIGQLIGNRYKLTSHVSEGGYGNVFKAVDTQLNDAVVAVKLLRPPPPDMDEEAYQKLKDRFLEEARVSTMLGEHPCIVEVKSYGVHLKQPYLVMEYLNQKPITGQGLDMVLGREKYLTPQRVVHLAEQICAGLHHAHCFNVDLGRHSIRGVIHRDIKPSNIFVLQGTDAIERVKLLDFGISKLISDSTSGLTQSGYFLGTMCYASPEQMRGERLDARSDIYSFGIVLYELLTGNLPFTPQTDTLPAWYHVHNYEKPHAFRRFQVPHTIPRALQAIVLSCLEKDPHARPQTMADLSESLQAVVTESNKGPRFSLPFIGRRFQSTQTAASNEDQIPTLETRFSGGKTVSPYPANGQNQSNATEAASLEADYETVVNWIENGNLKNAIQLLNQMIQIEPNEHRYYLQRGIAHLRQSNWGMAQIDFQGVLRLDPDNQEALQGLKNAIAQKVDRPVSFLAPANDASATDAPESQPRNRNRTQSSPFWKPLVLWGLASGLGSLLGRGLMIGCWSLLMPTETSLEELAPTLLYGYVAMGMSLMGLGVALPQRWALRSPSLSFNRLALWLVSMPLAYGLGGLGAAVISQYPLELGGTNMTDFFRVETLTNTLFKLHSPGLGVLLGILVGSMQWVVLHRQLHRSGLIVVAGILDLTLSTTGLGLISQLDQSLSLWSLIGLGALLDNRLLTGVALITLHHPSLKSKRSSSGHKKANKGHKTGKKG